MKRSGVEMICAVLLMATALSFCACGNSAPVPEKEEDHNSLTQETAVESNHSQKSSEYVWKSEFVPIESDDEIQPVLFTENGFYSATQKSLGKRAHAEGEKETYEGEFDIYGIMLCFVDDQGKISQLPNYTPALPADNPGNYKDFYSARQLTAMGQNTNGQLVILETEDLSWFDGPEGVYGTDEQYDEEYYVYEQRYELVTLEPDGKELRRVPLKLQGEEFVFSTPDLAIDPDGNTIISLGNVLWAFTPDGETVWSIPCEDSIRELATLSDGNIGVVLDGEKGMELRRLDCENKTLGEAFPLPDSVWTVISGDQTFDLYYTSGIYLYGLRLGEKKAVQILNWLSCDIDGDALEEGAIKIEDDIITGVVQDSIGNAAETQIFTLTKVPAETLPAKRTLTVAQLETVPDDQLTAMMVHFNRTHENIRIEYADYAKYGSEYDNSAGITKFNAELMAGSAPDIIPTGQIAYRQIAAMGLLEDLYPYIDADKELQRESFFPNLLKALEVDGGLYQMVPGFTVETLSGAASIVGDTPGWSYTEFNAALEKMPEDCTPMEPYVTREEVFRALLSADLDSYVDWTSGTVNFDSEEFRQMLEFVMQFPAEYRGEESTETETTQELIRQGRQMLTRTYLFGLDDILWNDLNFGGKVTFIGWPTNSGVGSFMKLESGFAISAKCADKESAWEFLRGMLTAKGQENSYVIPSNRSAFEKQLKDFMTPRYLKDDTGNYLLDEEGNRIEESRGSWIDENGEEHYIYTMTQEQAEEIIGVIETCSRVASSDNAIIDIVYEQAQACFAGQKSADEVARLIQSMVSIYVNEQR